MTETERMTVTELINLLLDMNEQDKKEALAMLFGLQTGKQLAAEQQSA